MLNLISNFSNSYKNRKRLGRGHSSGQGKTSGKGHKGQKARSGAGGSFLKKFEGGQTPIYRKYPKRGFSSSKNKDQISIQTLISKLLKIKHRQEIDSKHFDYSQLGLNSNNIKIFKGKGEIDIDKLNELKINSFENFKFSKSINYILNQKINNKL